MIELPGYTKWIFEVIYQLGITPEEGEELFRDPNWFFCYDDGMTPEAAIEKAKKKGLIMKIEGVEVSGHFIMICNICKKVIAQCKCTDLNKKKIYSVCDDCKESEKIETIKDLKNEITAGEKLLVEHFRGMNGSFYQSFFNAALKADGINLTRLEEGFPEEIQAVRKYQTDEEYWEKLQQRYDSNIRQ